MAKASAPSANFFREAIAELKKVTWPTRQEALRLSTIILIATVVSGMIIGFIDFMLAKTLSALV